MELSFSPDLDAYICYLVVLASGSFWAVSQLSSRLGLRPTDLLMLQTYPVLAAYILVPPLLFWFLDRAGAIHDTSLFAALLVGLGYTKILSGGVQSIQVSENTTTVMSWLLRTADDVKQRVLILRGRNQRRRLDEIVSIIAKDPGKIERLTALVRNFVPDFKPVQEELDKIEKDGGETINLRKVQALYDRLKAATDDYQYALVKEKLISNWEYWWLVKDLKSKAVPLVLLILLVAVLTGAAFHYYTRNEAWFRYYLWRVQKPHATERDRLRSREHMAFYLMNYPKTERYAALVRTLNLPGISKESVELAVGLVRQTQAAAQQNKFDLPGLLIHALRSATPDNRFHIHEILISLATDSGKAVPVSLGKDWKPRQGESIAEIERRIREWYEVFPP